MIHGVCASEFDQNTLPIKALPQTILAEISTFCDSLFESSRIMAVFLWSLQRSK